MDVSGLWNLNEKKMKELFYLESKQWSMTYIEQVWKK